MWRPEWLRSARPTDAEGQAPGNSRRDRIALLLALVTVAALSLIYVFSKGTHLLMPGPLASAHGSIENCSACHTKSGSGKLTWMHGLVAGDPLADSKACLTCHKMPETAFNAHGAPAKVLEQSTERLSKIAARSPQPQSARAQSVAFPMHDVMARDLYCATCHQEHQGVTFDLSKISNEQCRSCHVVKFDSFDGNHPTFDTYPFSRRTRIIYDHAGHFGKHFPEVAKKDPAKRIPETCSSCHDSREDKRVMAVTGFDKTCTACHLDQIVGKERASGPKGIAFLSLPGLDLPTLKKKNASIGEWPDASDAALTPFMKAMISRDERGRALIETVDGLDLQDLTAASDDQIKAVTELAWEIKRLLHGLIKGKASDVLSSLNIGGGAKLSASLVADLTASIPRDVLVGAQQEWLPNLPAEMAGRPDTAPQDGAGWSPALAEPGPAGSASPGEAPDGSAGRAAPWLSPQAVSGSAPPEGTSDGADPADAEAARGQEAHADGTGMAPAEPQPEEPEEPGERPSDERQAEPGVEADDDGGGEARSATLNPPVCIASIFGQCLMYKEAEAVKPLGLDQTDGAADPQPSAGEGTSPASALPGRMNAGVRDAGAGSQPEQSGWKTDVANSPRANPPRAEDASEGGGRPAGVPAGSGAAALKYAEAEGPDVNASGAGDGSKIRARMPLPSGTPRSIEALGKDTEKPGEPDASAKPTPAPAKTGDGTDADTPAQEPRASEGDVSDRAAPGDAAGASANADAGSDAGKETPTAGQQPESSPADQSDDLLFPTEAELREINARSKNASKAGAGAAGTATAASQGAAPPAAASEARADAPAAAGAAPPQARALPVISIESDVDPESWAEYGGWYRQDHAIFYRPIGHKDKLIYSWLYLTGPQAPKGDTSPAAAVFDTLTGKDAQGSCTKCHSIDDIEGKGRLVNFSPTSAEGKQGRFTRFIHEPHFGVMDNRDSRAGGSESRGCLTCHNLEKTQPEEAPAQADTPSAKPEGAATVDTASKESATPPVNGSADGAPAAAGDADKSVSPYLKSYEQGDPHRFASSFGPVKKDLCQSCHTSTMARQDCLLCHKYHVNDPVTPIIGTKIPAQ